VLGKAGGAGDGKGLTFILAVIPFWHLQVDLIGAQLSCCLTNETETRAERGLEMVSQPCLLVGNRPPQR
jgi:hypothetical protein